MLLSTRANNPGEIAALLAGGTEPDVRDRQGDTALIIAAKKRREHAEEIEALLKGGADPCLKDRKGFLPYHREARNSRGWHLLDRAGAYSSESCKEKALAKAPTQKPQETAGRNKATTATAAKQQPATKARPKEEPRTDTKTVLRQGPAHADENGCWVPRDGCLDVWKEKSAIDFQGQQYLGVAGKNNCGGDILTVLCAQWNSRRKLPVSPTTWSEWLQGKGNRPWDLLTTSAYCVVTHLRPNSTRVPDQFDSAPAGYERLTRGNMGPLALRDYGNRPGFATGKLAITYIGTVAREGDRAAHLDQHMPCLKQIVNPHKGL